MASGAPVDDDVFIDKLSKRRCSPLSLIFRQTGRGGDDYSLYSCWDIITMEGGRKNKKESAWYSRASTRPPPEMMDGDVQRAETPPMARWEDTLPYRPPIFIIKPMHCRTEALQPEKSTGSLSLFFFTPRGDVFDGRRSDLSITHTALNRRYLYTRPIFEFFFW